MSSNFKCFLLTHALVLSTPRKRHRRSVEFSCFFGTRRDSNPGPQYTISLIVVLEVTHYRPTGLLLIVKLIDCGQIAYQAISRKRQPSADRRWEKREASGDHLTGIDHADFELLLIVHLRIENCRRRSSLCVVCGARAILQLSSSHP